MKVTVQVNLSKLNLMLLKCVCQNACEEGVLNLHIKKLNKLQL